MRKPWPSLNRGFIVASLAILLCASPPARAWKEHMHKGQLTPMALDLVKLLHSGLYPGEIWEAFRAFIEQGSWDEDFPCRASGVRSLNHYFHPLSGWGLSDAPWIGLKDPDVDTLTWAINNAMLTPAEEFNMGVDWAIKSWGWSPADVDLGDMSWDRAIARYGYSEDSKRLAYYTLGFVCHLLEDMGEPEHLHDDPHGASGYTGFEWWVWQNWNSLRPPVLGDLKPRKFESLEGFFKNLALLGYSIDRFEARELAGGPANLASTDLGKMFDVRYDKTWREWVLGNYNGQPILGWSSPAGGTNFINWEFEWNPADYARSPVWTKGHDGGEWWPTSVEIPGSSLNDEKGFYYIELSGDLPGEPFTAAADPGRNLYPAAFLPTPLPAVADQCRGWRAESARGLHLYSLIGSRILPAVVEHTAGLIEHYFDIVNHPPFVRSLQVSQPGGGGYSFHWEDKKEPPRPPRTISDVGERGLIVEFESRPAGRGEVSGLAPGRTLIRIVFSEPVRSVDVKVGGTPVPGLLDEGETVWTAEMTIEQDGPPEETREVSIYAEDKNNHFRNEGGKLDGNPATPARRTGNYPDYRWTNYESGEDTHYRIPIKRSRQPDRRTP